MAYDADGTTVRGVFGPSARDATCPYPEHRCAPSDINYLVVADDRIPWGHLNVVDLGTAGFRIIGSERLWLADGGLSAWLCLTPRGCRCHGLPVAAYDFEKSAVDGICAGGVPITIEISFRSVSSIAPGSPW